MIVTPILPTPRRSLVTPFRDEDGKGEHREPEPDDRGTEGDTDEGRRIK